MTLEQFALTDHVAIITAAGRGIGAGIAVQFAQAGADVVIAARTADQLADVKAQVEAAGRTAIVVAADLSEPGFGETLVNQALESFGRVDTVVNNLGGTMPKAFGDASRASFERALSFNVGTAYELTQSALDPLLVSPNASVINIASVAGIMASRAMSSYGTAKAAMISLTRQLAQELAPKVRVNAIAPGFIETSATEMVTTSQEMRDTAISNTPMRRFGQPADIANAALYLASPAASFVTGVLLPVHGGAENPVLNFPLPDL